jgi:hypothetical protein
MTLSRISRAVLPALLLVGGPGVSGAALAQSTPAVSSEHAAACDALALTVADGSQIATQVNSFLATFEASMKPGDGSIGDLNVTYPGLKPKLVAAMRPIVIEAANKYVVPYRAEMSQLYCANLSIEEARIAKAEMSAPAFRSFVQRTMQEVKFDGMVKDIIAEKDITDSAVRAEYKSAATRVTITPDESAAILRFLSSPTGRKLTAMNAKKAQIEAKWFNYSAPEDDRAIELAVINTMADHIALTDKGTADELRKAMLAEFVKPAASPTK